MPKSKLSELKHLYTNFEAICKKILRRNSSVHEAKVRIREYLVIKYYNEIAITTASYLEEAEIDESYIPKLTEARLKISSCLKKLNSTQKIEKNHTLIAVPERNEQELSKINKIIQESRFKDTKQEIIERLTK